MEQPSYHPDLTPCSFPLKKDLEDCVQLTGNPFFFLWRIEKTTYEIYYVEN